MQGHSLLHNPLPQQARAPSLGAGAGKSISVREEGFCFSLAPQGSVSPTPGWALGFRMDFEGLFAGMCLS